MNRLIRRVLTRWRVGRVFRWLTKQEDVLWVSVIVPTPDALQAGPPTLANYRGVHTLLEIERGSQVREWHLYWSSEWAADVSEKRFASTFGTGSSTRMAIWSAEIAKEKWWRRVFRLGVVTTLLASIAAILVNIEVLKNVMVELYHPPEISLELRNRPLRAASNAEDADDIAIRGDPFFRSRISGMTMRVVPNPRFPGMPTLPATAVGGANRSLGISEKITVSLPIHRLPAGKYRVILKGDVSTAWRSGHFAPSDGIPLEVRPPVAVQTAVIPKQTEVGAAGLTTEAFLDMAVLFGRVENAMTTVQILVPGHWSGYSFEQTPPGSQPEAISKNSLGDAKAVAFRLRYLGSKAFSVQSLRISVTSPVPLSKIEWQNAVAGGRAQLEGH
jgi:hypothetical protein